jgi:hypothetical protein
MLGCQRLGIKALIDRAIRRVFVATRDPDPRNSGAGISCSNRRASWSKLAMLERGDRKPGAVFGERPARHVIVARTCHEMGWIRAVRIVAWQM